MGEPKTIKAKLKQLLKSPLLRFPASGDRLTVPYLQGVYIIYDPKGRVVHVGRTVRGRRGLHQRINNHLHGRSSWSDILPSRSPKPRLLQQYLPKSEVGSASSGSCDGSPTIGQEEA